MSPTTRRRDSFTPLYYTLLWTEADVWLVNLE
jgi:hypothetical protein